MWSRKAAQSATSGDWPDSGKADTALSRAESKPVSVASMKGEEADRATKWGQRTG